MKIQYNQRNLVLIALVVSVLLVILLAKTEPDKDPQMKALAKVRVELVSVQQQDVKPVEQHVGRLIPVRRAQLRFEVSGQVAERLVEPGQKVAQGAVLLRLQADDYVNAAIEARAAFDSEQAAVKRDKRLYELAKSNRVLQQKELKRQQRLLKKNLTSRSKLDAAQQQLSSLQLEEARLQYSVETAQSRLDTRKATLARAERNVERSQLTSPWLAIVNQVFVQTGDYVTPNKIAIEIVDNSELEFKLVLRGVVAHKLNMNDPVQVQLNGQQLEGRIVALQLDPDPSTYTHEVRVRLPAGSGYPGQMIKANIVLPEIKAALVVPVTALLYEEGKRYVMVYQDGTLQRRQVQAGARIENQQVILSGLVVSEQVVSRDVASLSDGQPVTLSSTDK